MKNITEEIFWEHFAFGWIDPKGKVLLPSIKDFYSNSSVHHATILPKKIKNAVHNKMFTIIHALKSGWIRWAINIDIDFDHDRKKILFLDFDIQNVNLTSLLTGINEIEDLIFSGKLQKLFLNREKTKTDSLRNWENMEIYKRRNEPLFIEGIFYSIYVDGYLIGEDKSELSANNIKRIYNKWRQKVVE